MKRLGTILAIALGTAILMMLIAVPTDAKSIAGVRPVVGVDGPVTVDVWTDRAEGSVYRAGESIALYFYASADCFVTIYDIDTDGRVNILFPEYPDEGFVYGGMTYRLPDYYRTGSLYVNGPRGIEYVHAVATRTPNAFRIGRLNGRYHLGITPITGDPFEAINSINAHIIRSNYISSTATTWFFVGSRVWYPRYMCGSCHGSRISFDPYTSSCSRYSVHVSGGYDYWWNYSYYPKVSVHFSFGGPFWRFHLRTIPAHRHRHIKYIDVAYGYHNYYCPKPPRRPYKHIPHTTSRTYVRRDRVKAYEPVRYGEIRQRKDTRDPRTKTYNRRSDRSNQTRNSRSSVSDSRTSTSMRSGRTGSPGTSTGTRSGTTSSSSRSRTGNSWDGTATSSQTRTYYDGSSSSRSSASNGSSSSRSRESSRSSYDDDRSSRSTRSVAPQAKTQNVPSRTPARADRSSRSRSSKSTIQTSRMPSAPKSKASPSRSASSSRSPGSDSRSRQQSSSSSSSRSRTRTR